MEYPRRVGILLFVRAVIAIGIPWLITIIWVAGYLCPFRTGRAVLGYQYVWLTKGYEAAVARGTIQMSVTVRQYFDGDPEPSLNEFLDTDSGGAAITGWYCERILPYAVAGTPTGSAWEHMGIYLVSERLLSDDGRATGIILPCWLLTAISLGIASPFYVGYFKHRRAMRRFSQCRCVKCGYDLRASGSICPECGAGAQ